MVFGIVPLEFRYSSRIPILYVYRCQPVTNVHIINIGKRTIERDGMRK